MNDIKEQKATEYRECTPYESNSSKGALREEAFKAGWDAALDYFANLPFDKMLQKFDEHFKKLESEKLESDKLESDKLKSEKLSAKEMETEKQNKTRNIEFTPGDFVVTSCAGLESVAICKTVKLDRWISIDYYVICPKSDPDGICYDSVYICDSIRTATAVEKESLLDRLAKCGLRWNAERKRCSLIDEFPENNNC